MEYDIDIFEQVTEYAKNELGYSLPLHITEFIIWCSAIEKDRSLVNDKTKLCIVMNTVQNACIKANSGAVISVNMITDYVIDNYDKIKEDDMSIDDILTTISNEIEEMEEN